MFLTPVSQRHCFEKVPHKHEIYKHLKKFKVKSNPSLSWAWPSSAPACFSVSSFWLPNRVLSVFALSDSLRLSYFILTPVHFSPHNLCLDSLLDLYNCLLNYFQKNILIIFVKLHSVLRFLILLQLYRVGVDVFFEKVKEGRRKKNQHLAFVRRNVLICFKYGGCPVGVLWASGCCLVAVWRVCRWCLESIWMVSGRYLWHVQMVCGVSRYIWRASHNWISWNRSSQDRSSQDRSR